MLPRPRFEDVYPRYPFAPLVRAAIRAAAWIVAQRGHRPRPVAPRGVAPAPS